MKKTMRVVMVALALAGAGLMMGANYNTGKPVARPEAAAIEALATYADGIANCDQAEWRELIKKDPSLFLELTLSN